MVLNVLYFCCDALEDFGLLCFCVLRRNLNSTFMVLMSKAEFKKFFQTSKTAQLSADRKFMGTFRILNRGVTTTPPMVFSVHAQKMLDSVLRLVYSVCIKSERGDRHGKDSSFDG